MPLGDGGPPVVVDLEVFNRTEIDLLYIAADGERLLVPACGSARDMTFRIELVEVRAAGGYVHSFGGGNLEHPGEPLHAVHEADIEGSGFPTAGDPPDPLPPCRGAPQVQRGF